MKKSVLSLISILLIATFALSACATPTPAPTAAPATEVPPTAAPTEVPPTEGPTAVPTPAGTLTIWADDTRAPILQALAPDFLAKYNIELNVELKTSLRDDFQTAAPTGEGPDILFGVAHDQGGTLVANGLVAPIDLGDKLSQFDPNAIAGCTYEGKLYCMPYATENLGFFYNTDLVKTPPATWDDVVSIGEQLKKDGKVDYIMSVTGTTYDAYPLYTAFGGYIFGKDASGNWNPQDVGVDSTGMVAGVKWLADHVANGDLPKDWDWANNHALFETGKTPFIMAGPWALDRIRTSKVPYAVTNFPSGPAGEGFPFLGVQGIFINAQSKNALLAQAFLTEFVATDDTMQKLYDAGKRPSAWLPVLNKTNDPDLLAMAKAGAHAQPMPSIAAMGSVWGNWDSSVVLARDGKEPAAQSMKEGADKIRALIANPKTGMVNVPGSYQDQVAGCTGQWLPDCDATAMKKGDDGKWHSGPFNIKKGDYEVKVALDGSWDTNYGADGKPGGDNIKFSMAADGTVEFVFDPDSHILTVTTK